MIHSIKQYSGKIMDFSGNMVEETLSAIGISGIFGLNCLTLRPFFKNYHRSLFYKTSQSRWVSKILY